MSDPEHHDQAEQGIRIPKIWRNLAAAAIVGAGLVIAGESTLGELILGGTGAISFDEALFAADRRGLLSERKF